MEARGKFPAKGKLAVSLSAILFSTLTRSGRTRSHGTAKGNATGMRIVAARGNGTARGSPSTRFSLRSAILAGSPEAPISGVINGEAGSFADRDEKLFAWDSLLRLLGG